MDEDKNSLAYRILRDFDACTYTDNKIQAIKLTRNLLNLSLLEAKRLVEGIIKVGTNCLSYDERRELEQWRSGKKVLTLCGTHAQFAVRYSHGETQYRCAQHVPLTLLTQLNALGSANACKCNYRI